MRGPDGGTPSRAVYTSERTRFTMSSLSFIKSFIAYSAFHFGPYPPFHRLPASARSRINFFVCHLSSNLSNRKPPVRSAWRRRFCPLAAQSTRVPRRLSCELAVVPERRLRSPPRQCSRLSSVELAAARAWSPRRRPCPRGSAPEQPQGRQLREVPLELRPVQAALRTNEPLNSVHTFKKIK